MTVYIILLILVFIYGLILLIRPNNKNMKKVFLLLSFFSFTLILGLRGDSVGEDTLHYINIFNNANNVSLKDIFTSPGFRAGYFTDYYGYTDTIEGGFLIWCKFIRLFSDNPQVYLFLTAGITCFFFAKFIYDNCKDEDVFLPTMIYLCESTFMVSFNLVREMMACAIAIQAYKYLKQKKVGLPLLIILIAASIHNTALITLLFIPIMVLTSKNKTRDFNIAAVLAILLPIISLSSQNLIIKLFPRYTSYFTINYWQNTMGKSMIFIVIEILAIFIMYNQKFIVPYSARLSVMVMIYIAFEIAGLKVVMLSRIGLYFREYLILFFNKLLFYYDDRNKLVVKLGLLILLIAFYLSYASAESRNYVFFWN